MGYFRQTLYGVSWMGGLRGSTRIIAYVRIAILARILAPDQFGLFGIVTLVLAFLEILTETGINVMFVQGEAKLKEYINTAYFVSITRGVLMALVIVLLAPLIAKFFDSPEAYRLIALSSLIPFLRGFINPSIVKFRKDLQFKREFGFRLSIFTVESVVAVIIALITSSAISLVWGLLAGVVVEIILSFALVKPWPKLGVEMDKFKHIISRGKWVTISGISDYLFKNLDDVAVGRMLGTYSLGIYQMAYKIGSLPVTEVADVFNRVTFPVYSKLAKDKVRLLSAFKKTLGTTLALAIPFGIALSLFAEPLVRIILGADWLEVVPIVRVLAVFGVIRAATSSFFALFLGIKKQEYMTSVTVVSLLALAICVIPLVNTYGTMGAAYSALIGSLIGLIPLSVYSYKVFKAT